MRAYFYSKNIFGLENKIWLEMPLEMPVNSTIKGSFIRASNERQRKPQKKTTEIPRKNCKTNTWGKDTKSDPKPFYQ